jgi:hypothetical protein
VEANAERQAGLKLAEELIARCERHGIPAELDPEGLQGAVSLELPSGRKRRPIVAWQPRIEALLDVPFEDLVLLGRLQAICSYEAGWIEALVVGAAGRSPIPPLLRRLQRGPDEKAPFVELERGKVRVTIGPQSAEMRAVLGPLRGQTGPLALRITGLEVERHDDALALLERLADSVFFEIDSKLGVPLVLDRGWLGGARHFRSRRDPKLTFPTSAYNADPMALYWYGRGAANMPLLQFLAFYQVLEFYFPLYAEQEVRRRIRGVVKDPSFSPHDEQQISRILRSMDFASRRGGSDERSQLRAVINACGDPEWIRDFVRSTPPRLEYFEKRKGGPARQILRPGLGDDELRDAVADRVYEIRCRIVHTKDSSAEDERLLPFSQEAAQLQPDIELLEGLARAALVESSRELRLSG